MEDMTKPKGIISNPQATAIDFGGRNPHRKLELREYKETLAGIVLGETHTLSLSIPT